MFKKIFRPLKRAPEFVVRSLPRAALRLPWALCFRLLRRLVEQFLSGSFPSMLDSEAGYFVTAS
ncbi:MAG TPA: hypothetical protein DCK93_12015 [Blastocatellia bacterium]|nr:hypothetical protein [Blastocatellia bacterium]